LSFLDIQKNQQVNLLIFLTTHNNLKILNIAYFVKFVKIENRVETVLIVKIETKRKKLLFVRSVKNA
jgi:hypothetical protein